MNSKIVTFVLLCAGIAGAQNPLPQAPPLIPQPAYLRLLPGKFLLSEQTIFEFAPAFENEAALLRRQLQASTGLRLGLRVGPDSKNSDTLSLLQGSPGMDGSEAYSLHVKPGGVILRAAEPAGMFRATQTLLQLIEPEMPDPARVGKGPWHIPGVDIQDAPRFQWRGLMLDCSRTFQSVEYLRQTLDRMACYKLNILHLHLTDDQGWRLELKRYPNLTRKAAFFPTKYHEPPSYQGYYTQQQLRELVAYAAARHILIVPEIEMPGHSQALLSAMPQLGCTGGPYEFFPYGKGPGITEDVLCAGKEATFDFLRDVIEEVAAIFPSPYVHVGGDEVPRTRWHNCPLCQERMKQEGLRSEAELQSWFNRRIERMLEAKGRRMVGWDEILEGGASRRTVVMGWRGVSHGLSAARSGHDVVMTPNTYCYFDYTAGAIDSADVFSYDPTENLSPEAARRILGVQACFWSHVDREPELVDRQLYPRLLALAERAWSPDNRGNWPDCRRRLQAHLCRLEKLGIRYEPLDLHGPAGEWTVSGPAGTVTNLEFDVSSQISGSGDYEVTAAYIKGRGPARLAGMELLRGAEVVARDRHESVLEWLSQRQAYRLHLPGGEGGTCRLRLTLELAGGTNSQGKLYILKTAR